MFFNFVIYKQYWKVYTVLQGKKIIIENGKIRLNSKINECVSFINYKTFTNRFKYCVYSENVTKHQHAFSPLEESKSDTNKLIIGHTFTTKKSTLITKEKLAIPNEKVGIINKDVTQYQIPTVYHGKDITDSINIKFANKFNNDEYSLRRFTMNAMINNYKLAWKITDDPNFKLLYQNDDVKKLVDYTQIRYNVEYSNIKKIEESAYRYKEEIIDTIHEYAKNNGIAPKDREEFVKIAFKRFEEMDALERSESIIWGATLVDDSETVTRLTRILDEKY